MILTMIALAMSVAPQVPESASFVVAPTVEVDQDRIYLGQVATCSGTARLCEEAYGIDLGAAPAPGKSLFLPIEKIKALLAKEWPGSNLRFEAAKPVKIVATGVVLDSGNVGDALRDRLSEGLAAADAFRVEVEKVQLASGLIVRPGDYRITFPELKDEALKTPDWVRKRLSGSQRLLGAYEYRDAAEGEPPVATFTVHAHLLLSEKLPVVKRTMSRSETVRAEDLEWRWVSRAVSRGNAIVDMQGLVGRRLTRAVGALEPVPIGAVEIPEVVRRGQSVRLEMRGRGVDVSGRVEVLEGGAYGEIVDAVYPATKKKLRVRVVNSETVEYLF